ncbi:hypothetical protein NKH18_14560 [Streptomyces sp. M10(2022)]
MAWRVRAATSAPSDGATAQTADATVNNAIPIRYARLRPDRSAQRPAGARTAAKAIAYALSTQERSLRLDDGNERARSGNAMLTMKRSSEETKTPMRTTAMLHPSGSSSRS